MVKMGQLEAIRLVHSLMSEKDLAVGNMNMNTWCMQAVVQSAQPRKTPDNLLFGIDMGFVTATALGLALALPERKVIAVDGDGYVYVADTGNQRIQKFSSDGQFVTKWGSWGEGDGEFGVSVSFAQGPEDVAVDANGFVYVADSGNHRIQKFDRAGNFIAQWGTQGTNDGQFSFPTGLEIDSNGFVYVMEKTGNRLQVFSIPDLPK